MIKNFIDIENNTDDLLLICPLLGEAEYDYSAPKEEYLKIENGLSELRFGKLRYDARDNLGITNDLQNIYTKINSVSKIIKLSSFDEFKSVINTPELECIRYIINNSNEKCIYHVTSNRFWNGETIQFITGLIGLKQDGTIFKSTEYGVVWRKLNVPDKWFKFINDNEFNQEKIELLNIIEEKIQSAEEELLNLIQGESESVFPMNMPFKLISVNNRISGIKQYFDDVITNNGGLIDPSLLTNHVGVYRTSVGGAVYDIKFDADILNGVAVLTVKGLLDVENGIIKKSTSYSIAECVYSNNVWSDWELVANSFILQNLQKQITENKEQSDDNISEINSLITANENEIKRLFENASNLENTINVNSDNINNEIIRAKNKEKEIEEFISELIEESPNVLNNIHEISDWISNNSDGSAAIVQQINDNTSAISNIENVNHNFSIIGKGTTEVIRTFFTIPSHTYRLYIDNPNWKRDDVILGINNSLVIFGIYYKDLDKNKWVLFKSNLVAYRNNTVKNYYDFTIENELTYAIDIRADIGEEVRFALCDLTYLQSIESSIEKNTLAIAGIKEMEYNLSITGAGSTLLKREIFTLPSHTYRLYISSRWSTDETTVGNLTIFQIKQILSGEEKVLHIVYKENVGKPLDVKSYYDFTALEGATYEIGIRADVGEEVKFVLHDTTSENVIKADITTSVEKNTTSISDIEEVSYNISIVGGGGTAFPKRTIFTISNHSYRLYVGNPQWKRDEVTGSGSTIFQIKRITSESYSLLAEVFKYEEDKGLDFVRDYYDFTGAEGVTYEIGLRANKGEVVQFVLHDTTDTLDHGSILYLNDERDVVPKMLAATRAAKRTGSTESLTPQLVLAHFSDIHASKANYNRVMEFCDKYSEYINDILHTGDTVNDIFGSISAWWSNNKVLNCIGNHDTAKYENGKYNWTGATPQETYDNYFAPYIASWGVIQPENAAEEGKCYYYKDYTEQGVRLITLDCMRYDDAQHAWLSQVLDNAKSAGLHVLVAVHYPLDRGTAVDTPFHSLQATTTTEADARIADVVASSGVQFIAYLCGHTHWDEFFKVKGYDGQICICVDSSAAGDNYNDAARTVGTKNQDSFNIFSVDTYGKMFRIFRVGCDRDRWMRHKGSICWDYANGKLIYQD